MIPIPEIVEVQIQVDGLQSLIGESIQKVEYFGRANVLIDRHEYVFAKAIEGSRITDVFRTGKYIIMELKNDSKDSNEGQYLYLLTHLGMSGAYLINIHNRHERIIFKLSKNTLVYKDMRYFGNLKLFSSLELKRYVDSRKLGTDALTASRYDIEMQLVRRLYDKKYIDKPIKQLLLDQTIISGLGNIYANEVLFLSRIHPMETPRQIGFADIKNLATDIQNVLELSYEVGGSSIKDYVGVDGKEGGFADYMSVYGKKGKKCVFCGTTIQVIKVEGRSSFYCPECQKQR